jgi:hypothetical protein
MKMRIGIKMFSMIVMFTTVLSLSGFTKDDQPTITKTFDLNQPGTLNAESSGGGVTVETHDQPKVVIEAFVRKNGNILAPTDPLVKEVLEAFDLDFSKNGTVITAKVERKLRMNFWNNVGISLTITVPKEMSCNVSSSGGGLKISGVSGTHHFSSSGGGVHLENVTGTTEAKSSGGGVHATNQNGDVRLSSSGGGVSLDDGKGSVYAQSSGGGVSLKNIHGNVEASSSGGSVHVSGEAASVRAKSSGGGVHAEIRNLSKELYLESSGGGVDAVIYNGKTMGLDLDLNSDRVNIELQNFSGKSEKNRVKGSMNNGGIPVYMHSSGGNVNVRFE